jgi:hypothetical protein
MSQTSHHADVEDLLPAAALEILDGEELGPLLAHARECAECGRLLDEYRAVVAGLAQELPLRALDTPTSIRLKHRLLARSGSNPRRKLQRTPRAPSPLRAVDRWAGWGVAAGLSGILLLHHGFHRPLAYGWIVAGVLALALVVFAVYAVAQQRRVAALEQRLAEMERDLLYP